MSARPVAKWADSTAAKLRKRWNRAGVHLFGKVGSTNDEAKRLAEQDAPAGTIVIAREQAAGRGRGGKAWQSPPNAGVYMSMVFRPTRLGNPHLLPVLAGLGVTRALDAGFSGLAPGLKWPNDIYAGGRKLAGILAEATWADSTLRHLVVGVGVNVKPLPASAPKRVRARATSLEEELGEQIDFVTVADAVISGLEEYLAEPPAALDHRALELVDHYDWLRDRRVRLLAAGGDAPLPGIVVGIAPDGALLFRPDRGALRRVHGAEVLPES
jgi:BirA family biotin operon repressor/biotin-[acetyl-CoA-carboxylase] ligase